MFLLALVVILAESGVLEGTGSGGLILVVCLTLVVYEVDIQES